MSAVIRVAEYVIFFSYCVISGIVGYLFVRHKSYIDTWVNRVLVSTVGLFLMLCALTHLYSIWNMHRSELLQSACAVVSFAAAVCSVLTFRGLDDYLRLRITTTDMMRQEIVTNLTKGYDLKVRVSGNTIVSGVAGSCVISEPKVVHEAFGVNDIIRVDERYFRIANIIQTFVPVGRKLGGEGASSLEEKGFFGSQEGAIAQVYGYDATAEVHMRKESERLNEVKMNVCMMTAHHVKTPLSCIGIALDRLRSRVGVDDLLDEALVHYELINMVITQFVDAAAMDSEEALGPSVDYVNVRDLVGRSQKVLDRLAMDGVRCASFVEGGVPEFVLTDGDWLMQILLNLVANSARHTFRGLISVDVFMSAPAVLSIVVKDTGIGLHREKSDLLQRDFLNDTFCDYGSTDMGMHTVDTKLRALGGDYDIATNFAEGTVLTANVPVRINEVCYQKAADSDSDRVRVVRVKKVLVVDDTAFVRRLMRQHLSGHIVDVAVNGVEGLAKMQRNVYDIVFLDIMMPVLDGLGCLHQFRKWETAHRDSGERQVVYCMSATCIDLDPGFDGSIPKPVDTKRLLSLVERSL